MTLQEFNKHIGQKDINHIFLFFGEEEYLKDFCIKTLKKKLLDDNDFNYVKKEGKIRPGELSELCEEMPMFGDKKLIIVKNSGLFGLKGTEDMDFLKDLPEYTYCVFREDDVDKRSKNFKLLNSIGIIFECERQDEIMIGKILTKAALKEKRQITQSAVQQMIMGIGDDLIRLLNELDKLILYTKESEIITDDHVKEVCELSVSSRIFDLTDGLAERNTEKAMKSLQYLIDNREAPQMIIVMISRHLLQLYDVKSLLEEGASARDIIAVLGLRDFIAKKLIYQCKGFTRKNLSERLDYCIKMDDNIKSGLIKDVTALELIVTL